ncbi:MAG: hypothetical protein E7586_03865 [Ruminococcaceae bacterium]|nr:hypothetical protein [Oscillospiraceae bacterium]
MPKYRRILSVLLAAWLCVMLIAYTYTWVSRNWTPSIKSNDINIASSGALVISVLGDDAVYTEVSLNDVVGIAVDNSFTFRQVSSQDGINFFWKDFSPTVTNKENPAVFYKIGTNDTRKGDYIDARFCLKLDDALTTAKYIFIHPDTVINYIKENSANPDLNRAIRISLTYDKDIVTDSGTQTLTETVILADLEDNESVINALEDDTLNPLYRAVLSDADGKTDAEDSGALGYQTVYGLNYFNCGRMDYNKDNPADEYNYNFTRDESKALFMLNPGEQKWVNIRIWLEGQDENCVKEIAGEKFNMVLKFDSAFVQ